MNEIIGIADKASQKDDRWLFIALLIVGMIFTAWALKYLVRQIESLVNRLQTEQESHEGELKKIIGQQAEVNNKLILSLDHNTGALANNATAFNECAAQLKLCREQTKQRS